ncbi:MAG: bifunctional 2-C-methyl-D-erythritol 4-phosphate cytidylyltransferase/2-C-methyl-D-erythritol 2,4-cyclodiphosphate synthase [Pseudomonadota bacterium]
METSPQTPPKHSADDRGLACHAIIVAAGRGYRASAGASDNASANIGPKQYQLLNGKAVLAHTTQVFLDHPAISGVTVVIHADDGDLYADAMKDVLDHANLLPTVTGGATRQASVCNGLEAIADIQPATVLIHDAARPFIDADTISRVVCALEQSTAALPARAVADTLKRGDADGLVSDTIDRAGLYAAQTPQGFAFDPILQAHRDAALRSDIEFTDDSALAEWAGHAVALVEGGARNSKITTADDLKEAKRTMTQGMIETSIAAIPDIRVGHGYDTHQQVAGDHVWLCGLRIDHTHGLSGHSDADVGLHALTDALLSTIADGDIGSHFPPSDPRWKGARSDVFLRHAVSRVAQAGGTITHMDVTLICEAPKIGPHRDAMRAAISDISGVDVGRIAVKATTNEQIGFVGRGEGIVALATATVVLGGVAS